MPTRTAALRLRLEARLRSMRRVALSHYVLNGLSSALGLLLSPLSIPLHQFFYQ